MLKKVLALAIAGAMVIGSMSMTAFAENGPRTAEESITISGLTEGDVVNFYKVIEWKGDAANNVSGWLATDAFKDILTSGASGKLREVIDPQYEGHYTGLTSEIAGDLSRASGKTVVGTKNVGSDGKAVLDVSPATLGPGMYMAIITPKDQNTVYNPVFVSADYVDGGNTWAVTSEVSYSQANNAQGAAKKSELKLDKTFENSQDYNGDNGATAAIGDVITFTVKTTIPGYGKTFDEPAFVIKDIMDNLEFQNITSVNANGLDEGEYTIAGKDGTGSPDATGYSVSLDKDYLRTLDVPTELTIVYTAKVTKEAQIANIEKETNTVTLEFSHDPSTETDGKPGGDKEYKKDKTNHYTFSIDADNLWTGEKQIGKSGTEIVKISVDSNGNPIYESTHTVSNITTEKYQPSPLQGAKFDLYKVKKDTEWEKETTPLISDVTSDAAGRIKFEGLDAGRYILVETEAPSGFVRDTQEHQIEITSHESKVKKTEYYDQNGNWSETKDATHNKAYEYEINELDWYKITFDGANVATHQFTHASESTGIQWTDIGTSETPTSIRNTQGLELPSTGGIGTTIFYAGGAVLVLLAGVLLVSKRRIA